MSTPSSTGQAQPAQALLREGLALLLTLVIGALLVALIVFAPQSFANFGYNTAGGFPTYIASVRGFFGGLLQGRLAAPAANPGAWRLLTEAARRTVELLVASMLVATPLGIAWGGLMASVRRRGVRALLFGLNTLMLSLPTVAVLLLAIEAVANITLRTGVQLTYVQGYGLDKHLILPAGTLVLRGAAYLARALQIAHDDVLRQEWIRAARARGLSGLVLWRRHVLPALRLPAIGALMGMLRVMVSGIIIVEYISGWNGLGRRMIDFEPNAGARPENAIAVAAALVLVVVFVLLDRAGQLAQRFADPSLRGRPK